MASFDETRYKTLIELFHEASLLMTPRNSWSEEDIQKILEKLSIINVETPKQLWHSLTQANLNSRLCSANEKPFFHDTLELLSLLMAECNSIFICGKFSLVNIFVF